MQPLRGNKENLQKKSNAKLLHVMFAVRQQQLSKNQILSMKKLLFSIVTFLLFTSNSSAVVNNWTAGSQAAATWGTAGNWSGGTPTATSDCVFPTGVTVVFSTVGAGSVAQSITINGTGSVKFNGANTVTVNSGGTINGTLLLNGTSSLTFSGGTLIQNGTITSTAANLIFNAAATFQYAVNGGNLPLATYNGNLTIANALGTVNLQAALAVGGNITINTNAALDVVSGSNFAVSFKGNWTNNGTFYPQLGTVTINGTAGTQTIGGTTSFYNLTQNNSGVTTDFGSSVNTIANTLTVSAGTMTGGTSTFIFTGATGIINGGNAKNFYNLQFNSGASVSNAGSGNIFISGSYTNNGTFTQPATRTTTFNGSGTIALSGSGTTTFGILSITPAATTVNAGSHNISIVGATMTATGTFNGNTGTVTIATAGTTTLAGSNNNFLFNHVIINSGSILSNTTNNRNFKFSGNWTNNGTYSPGTETVTVNGGSGTQTISGTTSFFNLTLNNSGATSDFGTSTNTIGGTFNASGGTMNGNNSTFIFTSAAGVISGSNAKKFFILTINPGASITTTGGNISILGTYINNGTFTMASTQQITFSGGGNQYIQGIGTSTFGSFKVSISGTDLYCGSHDLTVIGSDFDVVSGTTFNAETNTVTFNGGGTTTEIGTGNGTINFNNVTINAASTFSDNTNNKNFNVSGNWLNNGTYSCGTGRITFNATSSGKSISGTLTGSTGQFYRVTFNGIGGTWTFLNNADLLSNFVITNGIVTAPAILNIGGNFTNNGTTFNHANGTVNFTGSTYATIGGATSIVFYNMTVNKGTSAVTMLEATNTGGVSNTNGLTITNGIYKLTSVSAAATFFADPNFSSTAGIWLAGGSLVAGNFTFTNAGIIRQTDGLSTFGNTSGNDLINSGTFNFSGGVGTIAGRIINTGIDSMEAGTLTVCNVGFNSATNASFEMTAASNFDMAGGTLILQNINGGAGGDLLIISGAGTKSITGGTFQIGNVATPLSSTFVINTDIPVYNLTLNTNNSPSAKLVYTPANILGNLSIGTGASLDVSTNNVDINLAGNFTNNGTLLSSGSDNFTLNGTSAQTIDGTSTTTFNNLIINNTGGGVTVSQNENVAGAFTLTSGIVSTSANTIYLTNASVNALQSGVGNTNYLVSWVNGNLKRNVGTNGSYDFAVGTSSNSELANINFNSQSGVSNLTASFSSVISGNAPDPNLCMVNGTGIWLILDGGIWTITPDAQPSSGTYDITLRERGHSFSAGSPDRYGIVKRSTPSSDWEVQGTHNNATQSETGGTVTSVCSGLTSFSEFADGVGANPLLVSLLNFEGTSTASVNILSWTTASEENANEFELQKSIDGISFSSIGKIKAVGNSVTENHYSITDENPTSSTNYYRLKLIDLNKSYTFSNTILLNNSLTISFDVFPNPTTDVLNFNAATIENETINAVVKDIAGKIILSQSFSQGLNNSQINASELRSGIYFVELKNELGSTFFRKQFVKN